jgi:DNA helicase HerA-like ATPase
VQKEFADEIVTVVNQMRHTATSVIIASQNPDSIPSDVLEKSSIVILHRLTSPHQVGYLKKAVYGLSKVSDDAVAKLNKGEAIIWATESTDAQAAQSGIKVKIRPRFTRHV